MTNGPSLYHTMYPHKNFFALPVERQQFYNEAAERFLNNNASTMRGKKSK